MSINPKFLPSEATPLSAEGQILMKAADLIRQHGHAKFVQQANNGSMCIHGAISIAEHGVACLSNDGHARPAWQRVAQRVGISLNDSSDWAGHRLAAWNNAPERTAEEVIAALEGAALAEGTGT